jgi:hypothetical protein
MTKPSNQSRVKTKLNRLDGRTRPPARLIAQMMYPASTKAYVMTIMKCMEAKLNRWESAEPNPSANQVMTKPSNQSREKTKLNRLEGGPSHPARLIAKMMYPASTKANVMTSRCMKAELNRWNSQVPATVSVHNLIKLYSPSL